jgi:hypothetical protein
MQRQRKESLAETLKMWKQIMMAFDDNPSDLQHLQARKDRLQALITLAEDISQRQAAFTASRQDASRQLEAALNEGRPLATFLRSGVKDRYGNRSEKLVEFGMRPFRSRHRPAVTEPPPGPEAPALDPTSKS